MTKESRNILPAGWQLDLLPVLYVLFAVAMAAFRPLPEIIERPIHVLVGLVIVMMRPREGKAAGASHWIAWAAVALLCLGSFFNITASLGRMTLYLEQRGTLLDTVLGVLTVALVLWGAFRSVGWFVPAIVAAAIGYAFYSPYLPGTWNAAPYELKTVFVQLYMTTEGLWNPITGVSAREVAIFIIFGSILISTGAVQLFTNSAAALAGRWPGGAAHVAAIGSTLFGMVNGSAAANAASVGTITIPMMKRSGFPAPMAAAVEAVASTGGQLSPPIMGAAAFVMAEMAGVPYTVIATSAILLTIAYYTCVYSGIHFTAKAMGLEGISREERDEAIRALTVHGAATLVMPVGVLLFLMFFEGYSVGYSVTASILVAVVLFFLMRTQDLGVLGVAGQIWFACADAGRTIAMIAVLIAATGMTSSMFSFTGLGPKLAGAIIDAGSDSFGLMVLLGAIVSTLLGMSMPSVGAFVVATAVVVPALIQSGVHFLVAYMFVYYYAILAAITPPICDTLYVAAAIAKAHWWPASRDAVRLAAAAWIVPVVMIYQPSLLITNYSNLTLPTFVAAVTMVVGVIPLASACAGFLWVPNRWYDTIALLASAVLLILPDLWLSLVGACLLVAIVLLQVVRGRLRRATESV